MPFIGLSLILSVLAIIHVIKTGRSQLWVMVLLALPGIGVLAYLIVEILPEFFRGSTSRRVTSKVSKTINQGREFEAAEREYKLSGSVVSACNLADLYVERGEFSEAAELYKSTLSGLNQHNPDIMHKLATAQFQLQRYDQSKATLDDLIHHNPQYKNQDAHLLYARSLDSLGESQQAIEEYETLVKYYTGPEPAYHFGRLLQRQGQADDANRVFKEIIEKADISPKHYRKMHNHWITLARREL